MTIQSGYTGPRRSWAQRAIAAASFDSGAFEEVEADTTATGQAAGVVVVSAVAQGIVAWVVGHGHGVIWSLVGALCGWLIWAVVTYIVGTVVFKGTATIGELLRTLGFAQAPGVLYVLSIIPVLGWFVSPLIAIWILILGIIAIRQALDIDSWKAVVTAVIGWVVLVIPMMMFGAMAWMIVRH